MPLLNWLRSLFVHPKSSKEDQEALILEAIELFKASERYQQISLLEKKAIAFQLVKEGAEQNSRSKFGGDPILPADFPWPSSKDRELDFLLQVDLSEIASFDSENQLPKSGLLTFFYDVENQPWGFDPANLDGYQVVYFPDQPFKRRSTPSSCIISPECKLLFKSWTTFPDPDSWPVTQLQNKNHWSKEEIRQYRHYYYDLLEQDDKIMKTHHWLLGNSMNVQNDMQLEAQLVSNGLYCGNSTGYDDPRRKELEPGAADWLLLLQLDSDDTANLMWGDVGMLYFWIRKNDLANLDFSKTWMDLQCC
jgi:uncharacterized protein YwqG